MTEIQQQIEETIQKIVHLEKVRTQLQLTESELKEELNNVRKMEKILKKESDDIARLDGLSTKAIFYKILGSKEEQLEKQRQDYLELALQFEDTKKGIEILEYERNLLQAKLDIRVDLESRLAQLKEKREREIIQSDPTLRSKLLHVSDQLEHNYRLKKELQEALNMGNICLNLTLQVVTQLNRVRNWGQWGRQRGRPHRMMRRDAIDRARNISYQVKHHLHLFDKELHDLGRRLTFTFDASSLADFTDFFFDNLITDWIMQQKVTKALGSVIQTKDQLTHLLNQLERDLNTAQSNINGLKEKREKILIS